MPLKPTIIMGKRLLRHFTVEAIEAIHDEVLAAHGGLAGLRERSLLESAVAAPQASFGGKLLMEDPIEIAAAYLYYIAKNNAFLDGNKRTALASTVLFMCINDCMTSGLLDPDAWEALAVDVGASRLSRDQATERLRVLVRPIPA